MLRQYPSSLCTCLLPYSPGLLLSIDIGHSSCALLHAQGNQPTNPPACPLPTRAGVRGLLKAVVDSCRLFCIRPCLRRQPSLVCGAVALWHTWPSPGWASLRHWRSCVLPTYLVLKRIGLCISAWQQSMSGQLIQASPGRCRRSRHTERGGTTANAPHAVQHPQHGANRRLHDAGSCNRSRQVASGST